MGLIIVATQSTEKFTDMHIKFTRTQTHVRAQARKQTNKPTDKQIIKGLFVWEYR